MAIQEMMSDKLHKLYLEESPHIISEAARILLPDAGTIAGIFYDEIKDDLKTDGLAEVMTVDDGDETVRMWMSADNDKVLEFLLIVGGDDNVLIHITGNFNMSDLEGLAESFGDDIDIDLDL